VEKPKENFVGKPEDYPIVGTTYRVTEHWQAGAMTRNLDWLCELMPEVFVEMSEELAKDRGIQNGDTVTVTSARGKMTAKAAVTRRFKPFKMNGQVVHQVGIPWHWGYEGRSCGGSANCLTPHVGDANTMIPEYKAFLCDIRKEEG
jgi:formate dehydrogenase major subunit